MSTRLRTLRIRMPWARAALRTVSFVLPATLLAAPLAAVAVEAPQGAVVRWQGEAESCGMDGRTWAALDGTCYYAIDFERAPGRIEIARWPLAGGMESAWLDVVEKDFGEQDIEFPDDSYVQLSADDTQRHFGEQAEIKPIFRRRGAARFSLPLGPPADPLPAGDYFGVRRSFNGVSKNPHTGTDYPIGMGNPVLSVATGEVALTGEHFFAGRSVYVDHGDGLISMYFHLDSIDVEAGQAVEKGSQVGTIGSTGRSTGPHLHLGLRWKGARIEPDPLVGTLQVIDVP
ncbi:MAG: M23 family metallopeptidase [Acidobacteriota bacterium]